LTQAKATGDDGGYSMKNGEETISKRLPPIEEPILVAGETAQRKPFGERAVALGFVSREQVRVALQKQDELTQKGNRRLIGLIMLEMGLLDTTQLLTILKTYESEKEKV
jgi:hypothetical protein